MNEAFISKSNNVIFYILIALTFFTMVIHLVKLFRLKIKIHVQKTVYVSDKPCLNQKKLKHLKRNLMLRTLLNSCAFIFLLLAASDIKWGTYFEPVQNSSVSIALVFDISNSMNAKDGLKNHTRLESSAIFAKELLNRISELCFQNGFENPLVSVILAKGDGITAIPLTQDYACVESLLDELNTKLMSATGTNIARGILEAKTSFSKQYASAGKIWLFTDGEETEGQFSAALAECIQDGIPVSVVGVGSLEGAETFAGDGKTKIHTSLQKEQILLAIKNAENKYPQFKNRAKIHYYDLNDKMAWTQLVMQGAPFSGGEFFSSEKISYEAHPILRYKFFIMLGIICFVLNFLLLEFNVNALPLHKKNTAGLFMLVMLLSGCNSKNVETRHTIFKGVYSFFQKQYDDSICAFVQAQEEARQNQDELLYDYAVYNLSSVFLFKNEDNAASEILERLYDLNANPESMTPAEKELAYSVFYNSGILAHRNGNLEKASEYFRKALEADNTKIQAKINLELSVNQIQVNAKQNESKITPSSESEDSDSMDNSFFERIKENDRKQWKNNSVAQGSDSAKDY